MSKIKVACPECSHQYNVDETYIGKEARCKCKARFVVKPTEETLRSEPEVATEGWLKQIWENREAGVRSVAFSPDGRFCLSGSSIGKVKLWDVSTGKRVRGAPHPNTVTSVCFSPDGHFWLSGAYQHYTGVPLDAFRLCDASTGEIVRSFENSWEKQSVAFSPDGRIFVSGTGHERRHHVHDN